MGKYEYERGMKGWGKDEIVREKNQRDRSMGDLFIFGNLSNHRSIGSKLNSKSLNFTKDMQKFHDFLILIPFFLFFSTEHLTYSTLCLFVHS